MQFKIKNSIASNAAQMDGDDVVSLKRVLNRLGYYTPPAEIGIASIPDREMFDGLKEFQADQDLPQTGEIRPGDDTDVILVGEEQKKKKFKTQYTWRTVGDKRVRESHRALNGDTRIVGEDLDPGDDPGCRCWMENVRVVEVKEPQDICIILDQSHNRIDRKIQDLGDEIRGIEAQIEQKKTQVKGIRSKKETSPFPPSLPARPGKRPSRIGVIVDIIGAVESARDVDATFEDQKRIEKLEKEIADLEVRKVEKESEYMKAFKDRNDLEEQVRQLCPAG